MASEGFSQANDGPVTFSCWLAQRALLTDAWAAAVLAAVRGAAVWAGSWAGCTAGRAEADIRRRLWQGMITQASRRWNAEGLIPPSAGCGVAWSCRWGLGRLLLCWQACMSLPRVKWQSRT